MSTFAATFLDGVHILIPNRSYTSLIAFALSLQYIWTLFLYIFGYERVTEQNETAQISADGRPGPVIVLALFVRRLLRTPQLD